jgi:hypothetical protein
MFLPIKMQLPRDFKPWTVDRGLSTPHWQKNLRHHTPCTSASSNSFQQADSAHNQTQQLALAEFDGMVERLRAERVQVWVVDDTPEPHTPDSIFPNNWMSMHEDGRMVLYPMLALNRRAERRPDIAFNLGDVFSVSDILDYTPYEQHEHYLEGTGSMVLDREHRICYACLSPRTHLSILEQFCTDFDYILVTFDAVDRSGAPIYHTNVVMCVGSKFRVVCMECVATDEQRERIRNAGPQPIIEISMEQLEHFAGNMLEVKNDKGEALVVMSEQAYKSLSAEQVNELSKYAKPVYAPLYTIESNGGGSARCMMAEIFLPMRS